MAWTNDTAGGGSYTSEETTALVSWDDATITWGSSIAAWGDNTVFSYDSEGSGTYTLDSEGA